MSAAVDDEITVARRQRQVDETAVATVRVVDGGDDLQGVDGELSVIGKRSTVECLDDLGHGSVHGHLIHVCPVLAAAFDQI